jgi:hypothetical protein
MRAKSTYTSGEQTQRVKVYFSLEMKHVWLWGVRVGLSASTDFTLKETRWLEMRRGLDVRAGVGRPEADASVAWRQGVGWCQMTYVSSHFLQTQADKRTIL